MPEIIPDVDREALDEIRQVAFPNGKVRGGSFCFHGRTPVRKMRVQVMEDSIDVSLFMATRETAISFSLLSRKKNDASHLLRLIDRFLKVGSWMYGDVE